MKSFFNILLLLCSVFLISCEKYPLPDLSDIPPKEDPYKPEKTLPKEMQISGKYTLTKNNKAFQFNSKDQDWYCYKIAIHINPSDENIIPLRFRLYNKDNKLLYERLPFTNNVGRKYITKFQERIKEYPDEKTEEINEVWAYIPYHKEGVKIKAILVDDTGKDVKVLAERGILPPEEFRTRFFYQGCYRQVGFGIE